MIARLVGLLLVTAVGGYCLRICAVWSLADPAAVAAATVAGTVSMKLATAVSGCAQALTTAFILCTRHGNQHAGPIMGLLFGSLAAQALAFAGLAPAGDVAAIGTRAPGVPSYGTLLAFLLLGSVDFVYCFDPDRWAQKSFWPALAALVIGAGALLGYAARIPWLYWGSQWSTNMAVATATVIITIAAAHLIRIQIALQDCLCEHKKLD